MFLKVGVKSYGLRKNLIGIVSFFIKERVKFLITVSNGEEEFQNSFQRNKSSSQEKKSNYIIQHIVMNAIKVIFKNSLIIN